MQDTPSSQKARKKCMEKIYFDDIIEKLAGELQEWANLPDSYSLNGFFEHKKMSRDTFYRLKEKNEKLADVTATVIMQLWEKRKGKCE